MSAGTFAWLVDDERAISFASVAKLEETSGMMRLLRLMVAVELRREVTLMFEGELGEFTRTGHQPHAPHQE
jgi:hypothetical protein